MSTPSLLAVVLSIAPLLGAQNATGAQKKPVAGAPTGTAGVT